MIILHRVGGFIQFSFIGPDKFNGSISLVYDEAFNTANASPIAYA